MNEVDIKKKLEEFRVNKKAIEQICFLCRSCGFDVILNVAFKYEIFGNLKLCMNVFSL